MIRKGVGKVVAEAEAIVVVEAEVEVDVVSGSVPAPFYHDKDWE